STSSMEEESLLKEINFNQKRVRKNGLSTADENWTINNYTNVSGSMMAACIHKQKSISCDDMTLISSGDEGGTTIRQNDVANTSWSSTTTTDNSRHLKKIHYEKGNGSTKINPRFNSAIAKSSAIKERNEKRNSMGSTPLAAVCQMYSQNSAKSSSSKRLSSQCMDDDSNSTSNIPSQSGTTSNDIGNKSRLVKPTRSGLFTGGIFTRVS
ncbi:unnamed protein product, partial [Didymodactylos carnosus]